MQMHKTKQSALNEIETALGELWKRGLRLLKLKLKVKN